MFQDLFQAMFPDSAIAQDFNKHSAGKLTYMINHGLAKYFKMQTMQELSLKEPRLPLKFTSCFDESFNKISYSKQMGIHIAADVAVRGHALALSVDVNLMNSGLNWLTFKLK